MPCCRRAGGAIVCAWLFVALTSGAWAQGSLQELLDFSRSYSVGEQLSGHNAPSLQGLGMGGVLAALDSDDPINPAQNAELDDWWGQVRTGSYVAAGEGGICTFLLKVAGPIGSSEHPQGLSFHFQDLDSDPVPRLLPLAPPAQVTARPLIVAPAGLALSESDWGGSYGRRVGRRLAVGLTIAGDVSVNWDLAIAPGVLGPGPTPVMSLSSAPRSGVSGARIGALYQATDDLRLGLLCSVGGTDVTVTAPMSPPPNQFVIGYDSWDVRIGGAYRLTPRTTVALDMQDGHLSGASVAEHSVMWYGGLEQRIGSGLAIRFGDSDGSFTAGFGYGDGRWGLDYAFVDDLWRASLEPIYGDMSGHFVAAHVCF